MSTIAPKPVIGVALAVDTQQRQLHDDMTSNAAQGVQILDSKERTTKNESQIKDVVDRVDQLQLKEALDKADLVGQIEVMQTKIYTAVTVAGTILGMGMSLLLFLHIDDRFKARNVSN
jgi:hypothetical protein